MCFFEGDRLDKLNIIICNGQDHKLDWDTDDTFFNGLFLNYAVVLKKWGLVIVETVINLKPIILFFHNMHIKPFFASEW